MKTYRIMLITSLIFTNGVSAQEAVDDALIRLIDARTEQYQEYESFTASVQSLRQEMDKRWRPEKIVAVEKRIEQNGEDRREIILKGTETFKGKERDVTEELRDEERKRQDRAAKRRKEQEDGNEGAGFSMSLEDIFPFSEENRGLYLFQPLSDTLISGREAMAIQARAKEPSDKIFDGMYYVDKKTYDVLLVDVAPSKNPRFVKALRMRMWFDVLPGEYFVMTKYWMHVQAGFLFKKVRMEMEEVYTDYRISEDMNVESAE